jgi:chemotaxis protein CheD
MEIERKDESVNHYLLPGMLFAQDGKFVLSTVLGSCVSVCLWDRAQKIGGMNHYLLPLWNGEGLYSPKYGNIAIPMLITKMLALGCKKENLVAKYFGGGGLLDISTSFLNVGERNIDIAVDILKGEKIAIASRDIGGAHGRKVIFHTDSGDVFLKKLVKRESNGY